ncbi:3-oxoacyl-[acyl-carrier-protein] reductase FabG [Polystyrenella longa]|uniref:3-oxoacyl-[acyl-carrier-protein] reductase FabG n=1 Tax=Polystyrenella longa TaxID=2528007 RepID=A0A518CIE4_9PLAN|nr:SDR family oxidoreductase [Polystyrenella longa]QDU79008.1 3-oxoacyl-[acyl-carrier-protein] reductase FabG [Polystyrenella longa]
MSVVGQTAIVTGGAVRLGRAFALALAEAGANVVVHFGNSDDAAEETARLIRAMGRTCWTCSADFRDPITGTEALFRFVEEKVGPASILVNSAAIFDAARFEETDPALFDRTMDINFKAPFYLSRRFVSQVPDDIRGQIVNIVDWRAERIDRKFLVYSLAKNSLLELTKALAIELAPRIRVNAIAPGAILPPPGESEFQEGKKKEIPLAHTGNPDDLVHALQYLLNGEFVTGEIMHVTGGEHLTG